MSNKGSPTGSKVGSPNPPAPDPEESEEENENTPIPTKTAEDAFLADIKGLSDDAMKLLRELYVANGQDAFDAEAAAVGRLKQEEYLALPANWVYPRVKPAEVGRAATRDKFKARDLAVIYYLNKQRAPLGENAVTYAMLRMEAVKMGWVAGQKEIVYLPFTDYAAALREFTTDLMPVRNNLDTFRLAAFLVPLVAEHTFRTMGHHYITGLATEYQTRYRKTLRSCLAEEVMTLLQPANLFHHVLHWVSPERAYNVLDAQLGTRTLPDALIIRATSAPAGWAIVTTTEAVLAAMESANILNEIEEEFDGDLDEVRNASKSIKKNVRKWHKAYFAYNVAPPTPKELEDMNTARDVAISFAPYAQGFIEGTLRDAALGQAQALKKHSELNPVAKARAARFFRQLTRVGVSNVKDLFQTQLKKAQEDDE
jgi:hypothetical protein